MNPWLVLGAAGCVSWLLRVSFIDLFPARHLPPRIRTALEAGGPRGHHRFDRDRTISDRAARGDSSHRVAGHGRRIDRRLALSESRLDDLRRRRPLLGRVAPGRMILASDHAARRNSAAGLWPICLLARFRRRGRKGAEQGKQLLGRRIA